MATVLKVETTSSDGTVRLVTAENGEVLVLANGAPAIAVLEAALLEAVLEYAHAHERGLRRQRKAKAAAPRKRKPATNGTQPAAGIEA